MAALIPSASATGSGTMTLAGPSTNSNQTITIPDATGTMMVSGNMPAFSAYLGSAQSLTGSVNTKLQINTKEFDTASCFNTSTYRFTPNVAGYYQVNAVATGSNTAYTFAYITVFKNGAGVKGSTNYSQSVNYPSAVLSTLIYMNGTTDYLELYFNGSATASVLAGADTTVFQAFLARSA
jgi:hypothetical protein